MYYAPLQLDQATPELNRIAPAGTTLEAITEDCIFTEGPLWRDGALYLTDIRGDKILTWRPGEGVETYVAPAAHPDGMTLDAENRIVVAGWGGRTVWRLEHDGSCVCLAAFYEGKKLNSPNDIITRSDGSIYFTDPSGGMVNVGMEDVDVQKYLDYQGVFRIAPDGALTLLSWEDYITPNGICFSPDEKVLYVNDTRRGHIRAYDVLPDGNVRNDHVFAETHGTEPGVPDGMRCDVDGNVYCTGPGGIHVFDPAGRFLGRILIPKDVANMAWGDDDFRAMYLCARETVYRVRLNVTGIPHGERYRQQVLGASKK